MFETQGGYKMQKHRSCNTSESCKIDTCSEDLLQSKKSSSHFSEEDGAGTQGVIRLAQYTCFHSLVTVLDTCLKFQYAL